jgi:hypothetical protein
MKLSSRFVVLLSIPVFAACSPSVESVFGSGGAGGIGTGGVGGASVTTGSKGSGVSTGSFGGNTTASASVSVGPGPGATSTSNVSSGTSGGGCDPSCQGKCCSGQCAATWDDNKNCGFCGNVCPVDTVCESGHCNPVGCPATACGGNIGTCCDKECCLNGTICCSVPGPGPSFGPSCVMPVNGACPAGCPTCD